VIAIPVAGAAHCLNTELPQRNHYYQKWGIVRDEQDRITKIRLSEAIARILFQWWWDLGNGGIEPKVIWKISVKRLARW
jgi:hypothetical protein